MISVLILLTGIALVASCPQNSLHNQMLFRNDITDEDRKFTDYLVEYGKEYCDYKEYLHRKNIFFKNLKYIERNSPETGAYGVNQLSDITYEELVKNYMGVADLNDTEPEILEVLKVETPDSLDYRLKGCVTAVKNQGYPKDCGDCFSFSAIGAIEGQYCYKYGKLYSLSEQQGLDCSTGSCSGGNPLAVMRSLAQLGGSEKEEDYPYTAVKGQCRTDPSKIVVKLTGGYKLPIRDEETLKSALFQYGPLSFLMRAPPSIHQYHPGTVYNPTDCTIPGTILHAMVLVGYNTDSNGQKYWIVKNSWGPRWGNEGYLYIIRGPNVCEMYDEVFMPAF